MSIILGSIACVTGIATCLYLRDKNIYKLKGEWKDILLKCKTQGIRNTEGETFLLSKVYPKSYGYFCTVNIPNGCSIDSLENAKKTIEDNLHCLTEINKDRFKDYATVKIITKDFIDMDFKPVKTKPYQLYLGGKADDGGCFLDLRADAHLLIAGKTRFGKSYLFASLLTNLIYNNSDDFEVYLFQVMKGEIDVYRNCKPVRFLGNKEEEILVILKKIVDKINQRSKLFAEYGIKNIDHWNKKFPKRKMKRIIIGAEEISFFMKEDESGSIFGYFIDVVKAGASAGVHFIGITQRTTLANLPSELKSQMAVASTKQRSALDSNNAIDIPDAVKLNRQEFIVSCNDGHIFFKVPNIDEDFKILNKYVPEIITPEIKTIENKSKNETNSKQNFGLEIIDISKNKKSEVDEYIRECYRKGKDVQVVDNTKTETKENKKIDILEEPEVKKEVSNIDNKSGTAQFIRKNKFKRAIIKVDECS